MNSTMKKVSCMLLAGLLALSIGCSAQKKPLPKKPGPLNGVYPNVNLPKQGAIGVPGSINKGNLRYVTPVPNIPGTGVTRLEDSLSKQCKTIKGVNDASVVIIGKTALVGVDLNKNSVGKNAKNIKKQVAQKLKGNNKYINTVYVTSDPDLLQRLQDVMAGKSAPNVIGDLYNRMKMEK